MGFEAMLDAIQERSRLDQIENGEVSTAFMPGLYGNRDRWETAIFDSEGDMIDSFTRVHYDEASAMEYHQELVDFAIILPVGV